MSQPDLRSDPPGIRPGDPGPARGCIAGAMIIIGLVILVPSGLCSAILGVSALLGLINGGWTLFGQWGIGLTTIVFAIAVVGYLLIRFGRTLRGER